MEKCKNCNCNSKKTLEEVIVPFKENSSLLIPCLQAVQEYLGYISKEAIIKISQILDVPQSKIYGVITFYSQFRLTPSAKNVVDICMGTACYVLGANDVLEEFLKQLNLKSDEVSQDGKWLVTSVRCLGCCGLAPVVSVNGKVYGNVKTSDVSNIIKDFS